MGGNWSDKKYYPRRNKPGDTYIEGRASNGITLDNTGNVFIYSSHNDNIVNELTSSNYTGSIDISPNNDLSFIGIVSTSTDSLISQSPIDIKMGATNYTTLNLNTPKPDIIQPAPSPIPPPTDNGKFTHNPVDDISNVGRSLIPGKHYGTDFAVTVGSNVYAVWDGKVIVSQFNWDPKGFGTAIILEHEDKGYLTLYAHLTKLLVNANQNVVGGQLIGLSGGEKGAEGAGNSRGPHLHFELRKGTTKTTDGSYNSSAYFNAAVLEPLNYLTGSTPGIILPNTELPEPLEEVDLTDEQRTNIINNQPPEGDVVLPEDGLPENEDEGVVVIEEAQYSRAPTPEESGGEANEVTIQSSGGTSSGTGGTPSGSGGGCRKEDCKTSYPNLPFKQDSPSTTISLAELKKQIIAHSGKDTTLTKSLWALYWAESYRINYGTSPNSLFSTPNTHNYTGIQTDSGPWGSLGKNFVGQKCFKDANGCRAFALFATQKDALNFMGDRAKAKGFDKADTADKWAERHLNTWVFLDLEKQNKSEFERRKKEEIKLYNTAIYYYNRS
jgi:murein DD-endopeptidase MepM/ murein hydrolase activator NlpD